MKKLKMIIYALSLLFLTACGSDSNEQTNNSSSDKVSLETDTKADSAKDVRAETDAKEIKVSSKSTYTGFDIAGLYLGMSPEEVEASLKAYDPSIAIKKDAINFNYNALGKRYQTESFVNYINGTIPGGELSLSARFSYPPEPLKVVAISRGHRQHTAPVSQALYVESLIEKYGTPAMDSGSIVSGQRVERVLEWPIGSGTTQCLSKGTEVASTPPILANIERRHPNPTPEFTEDCISILRYVLQGDPVTRANGGMMDVAAAAKAELRAQAWLQSLIDEKSSTGTEKPKL